ncbi:MAG: imidazolonepropionase [Phycisphaerales bacterium]|nr:MAG: imidazolonepropionase [Phycisphaerales bacterium]
MSILITNARVLTMGQGPNPRTRERLADVGAIPRADVLIDQGVIVRITPHTPHNPAPAPPAGATIIDAKGRVLMPAFIDPHTHLCWAGDRLDEWQMKLAGTPYLDILKAGGGIMSTVRAVREASESALLDLLLERLDRVLRAGTTTIEIKSGYGLSTRDELKMLRVIHEARSRWPGTVVATALLGHAIDPDVPDFVQRTIDETLPAVHAEFPGVAIDAFCEKGAWSREQCVQLFAQARSLGHPIRVHADQFNSLGIIDDAIRLGAASVDHLEASTRDDLQQLSESSTFGVGLPCTGLHMATRAGGDFADLRALADLGGRVAIATNSNPGSATTFAMPIAMAAAVRFCGLTPQESIVASTANAGALLTNVDPTLADRGRLEPGLRADLVLLRHTDERSLAYEWASDHIALTICHGRVVFSA